MDGFNDNEVILDREKIMAGMSDLAVQMSQEEWHTYVNEVYPQFPISPWTSERWAKFYRERGIEPPPSKAYTVTYDSDTGMVRLIPKGVPDDE